MEQPNHPLTRGRGNSIQEIAAYQYLRKHAIGNQAERIERRALVGERQEMGETRRMNVHRIVVAPVHRERLAERRRPSTPPDAQPQHRYQ